MVKKALDALGDNCWRFMPVQSGYGTPSLDFMICVKGHFIAIETKKDAATPLTSRQSSTVRDMVKAGGRVFVVYDQGTLDFTMASIRLMMEFDNDANYPRDARHPIGTIFTPPRPAE
jgi:hypothetical protein